MNNDLKLLAERYEVVTEGKPFGIFSRMGSAIQSKLSPTSTGRVGGQQSKDFKANVNKAYDSFRAWLRTQRDKRVTVGNLVTYFEKYVGLKADQSPTLTGLLKNTPEEVSKVYNEFEAWINTQTAQPAPQPEAVPVDNTQAVQPAQPAAVPAQQPT